MLITNIEWDVEDDDVALPDEVELPDDTEDVAEALSDEYGYCVLSFSVN